ncbi:hypothetical protein FXO37_15155 [Capsicum annuum]|nr:hypothetical protein FXO37_15155 [Capsicum annuum]
MLVLIGGRRYPVELVEDLYLQRRGKASCNGEGALLHHHHGIVTYRSGHTAEMLNLLYVLQTERFKPRYYIAAATDNMSLQKAHVFEDSLLGKILCNGPGTCIPLCVIAFLFKILGIRWSSIFYVESIARVRKLSLSGLLLYKLHMADQLFVQWPQLKEKYPRAHYVRAVESTVDTCVRYAAYVNTPRDADLSPTWNHPSILACCDRVRVRGVESTFDTCVRYAAYVKHTSGCRSFTVVESPIDTCVLRQGMESSVDTGLKVSCLRHTPSGCGPSCDPA